MPGKFALIIGNSHYDDSSLGRLKAPDLDVQGLEEVLKAPDVGHFDEVTTLLNEGCASVRKAVARFYDQRQRDDLLLLYFSGHGVKDEQGHLYLALRDTESGLLAGTAMETAFITGRMDRSFSKRQVLVLDCCHSGAFAHGAKAAQGVSVGTAEAFEGTGLGRVILTATDSTQYAWDGDQIIGDAHNSLFTHFLIDGLKTGAADRDGDGAVTVDELYDYVREQVVNTTPRQTPHKWTYRQEGDIVLAQNPFAKRSTLPPEVEEVLSSKLASLRLEAVRDLEILLRGHHGGRARAALAALRDLSADDSRKVANAAARVLKAHDEEERRELTAPHLTAAREAIERKEFDRALESLRQVSELDREAEGLAELVRMAEEGQHAESESAVEAASSEAESPASTNDLIDGLTSDIFISYAREDREKARALATLLAARGWRVWWDRKIAPGEAFDVVIERQLCTCKCAVVLWSTNSVNATWVRNEARRASRRNVLVPILIDRVETPLEFENLQAADLTSWEGASEHPELQAVFDRIQALSPIPHARPAREEPEPVRREAKTARRFRELGTERARIEQLVGRGELDAAEEALRTAEKKFDLSAQFRPLRERLDTLREQAEAEQLEREHAETARLEAEAAQRQRELVLEQARVETERRRVEAERITRERAETARREAEAAQHHRELVLERARVETERRRVEAERIKRERAETARQEAEAAQRQPELDAEEPRLEEIVAPGELLAAEQATHLRGLSRSASRLIQVSAVLLALTVGTWLVGIWPGRAPDGPRDPGQPQKPLSEMSTPVAVPSPKPRTPAVESATASTPIVSPSPKPPEIERAEPANGADPGISVPKAPAESAASKQASLSKRLEELRTRSRSQVQAGQRVEALNTVVEGLQLDPKDSALRKTLDSLLRDAQVGAERSKRYAMELDASSRAEKAFGQGLQAEREAMRLRHAGRIEAATRSFWVAADEFKEAVKESRRIADQEEAEQARLADEQARIKARENERVPPQGRQTPNAGGQAERKPLSDAVERPLVEQTLRRYEAAYASLNADAVKSVYLLAPLDQLSKDFAGYRSYTLKVQVDEYRFFFSETLTAAIVTGRLVHDFVPKSGQRMQFERSQTLQLEKQGATWIIKQIR